MPPRTLSIAGIVSLWLITAPGKGVEPSSAGPVAVSFPAADSPWQFSGGVTVRSFSAQFHIDAPGPLNPRLFYTPRRGSGPGDVGVVTGPGDQIFYDDGFAGTDDTFFGTGGTFTDGATSVLIQSSSQFEAARLIPGAPQGGSLFIPGSITFHSHGTTYDYASSYAGHDLDSEDSDTGVGPYLNLRRSLARGPFTDFGVSLGWSFMSLDFAAGPQVTARQVITEVRRDNSYAYSYDTLMTFLFAPVGQRIGSGATAGVIYNPDRANVAYGAVLAEALDAPSTSSRHRFSHRTLAVLEAVSGASLDLDFNDVSFMADVTLHPSTWCSISLAAGPTINVFDYDFHTRTDWFLDGRRFATGRRVDSGSEVKAGARVLGLITCNLNREGTFFIEFGGGYDWVDSFTVKSGGGASVEIDASSWTTRGGLGFRF